MSDQKESLPYRPCVGIILLNDEREVFVGKRIDTRSEAWQMPQGGVDPGEDSQQAAFRELEEEIGTAKAEIIAKSQNSYRYDLPDHLIGDLWDGQYRGQEQDWFVMRFLGTDGDINIATKHPEFLAWKWTKFQDVPSMIVPFKRPLYEALVNEFEHIIKA